MADPYKMVVINALLFLIVVTGLFFYRFIFPQKKYNYLIVLIIFSLLPVVHIFRSGSYESGDFNTHVYRAIEFYHLLREGIVMPSWAGTLNATYGYPLFIFLNPLPYYFQALFHGLGFSFISSLKILIAISYILSGVFFYLWAKKEIQNSFSAFFGAIVYLFTPYHLVDLHFRVALGEIVFFMFLPLFFYSLFTLKEKYSTSNLLLSSFAFSCLMFSHQALTVFSLSIIIPYIGIYVIRTKYSVKNVFLFLFPIFIGSMFSAYIWIPHLYYPQFTLAFLLTNQTVVFPHLWELFFSPWRFGFLFQGPQGQLSYLLGYTQLALLLWGIYIIFQQRIKQKVFIVFWTILSILLIFMISPFSSFLWSTIPILNTAQFSTRFLLIFAFSISALSMYVVTRIKRFHRVLWIVLLITVSYTMLNWGQRRMIPEIADPHLIHNLAKSTSEGEGFCCMGEPKWTLPTRGWMSTVPETNLKVTKGSAEVIAIKRTSTYHSYVTSGGDVEVVEHTWFFPGWKVEIDNKKTPIAISKTPAGLISFQIPHGLHYIEVIYTDLFILRIAKIVSAVSMFIGIVLFIITSKKITNMFTYIPDLLLFHRREKRQ